jgi:formate dehydrogenase major subunit
MPLRSPLALLARWPLLRQLRRGADGTGMEAASPATEALRSRIGARGDGASAVRTARSVCPYCGVGCGQLVHHRDGKVLAIEGDPESPVNQGTLCPKGAASHQLLTHPGRLTRVRYRAPRATEWTEIGLDEAVDRVAELLWENRRRTFVRESEAGERVGHTAGVAHLGGATLDNEENFLLKKLFTAGLGMVAVSNQARI